MSYHNELDLLISGFKKCRLAARVVPFGISGFENNTDELERLMSGAIPQSILSRNADERTLYRFKDSFGLHYKHVRIGDELLVVGPYTTARFSESALLEIAERNGITLQKQRYLKEFYDGIPTLEEGSPLFIMLDTFLERVWKSPSFVIVDHDDSGIPPSPINDQLHEKDARDVLVNMKAMEQRYGYENALIEAVALGQLHKEGQLLAAFSAASFEKRLADSSRNVKNYAIIMNTLLRKAAEQGGVHPVYLDRISSDFAQKIEQTTNIDEGSTLMVDMFRAYCRLVRKHSMKSYSPLVQKTILIIDSDLSADLTLSSLAEAQGVSAGYLATVFKKETAKTVSEYVRERRIKQASHLLRTTNLQIQTVALHCGILDVQYFSKLFKRECGMTPKEYREHEKGLIKSI